MRLICTENYEAMSRAAANLISAQVILKPDSVLGLATGSTPIGAYKQLIEWYKKGDIDFSKVTTINLDEYRGLGAESDQSYRYFMNTNLFDHVNIDKANTYVPNGLEMDAEKACADHDAIIASKGGCDIQLLGIGRNGHIGFNEPCDYFIKETHCVDLTQNTIDANSRFFAKEEDVPRQAYTMGIGGILSAKKILLIACGADKAQAIHDCFKGSITPQVPGSILQLHSDVTVIGDREALSLLD